VKHRRLGQAVADATALQRDGEQAVCLVAERPEIHFFDETGHHREAAAVGGVLE
jgi:hypothetical protein